MDALLAEQNECLLVIARALPNIKRIGQKNFTVPKLQGRLQILKENFDGCKKLHWQLQSFADKEEAKDLPYFKDKLFLRAEEQFDDTADYVADWIAQLQSDSADRSSTADASSLHIESTPKTGSHLPRINLPSFSGDLSEWESFRDRFRALIIDDTSLSDVTRLHYLGSCLKGDASNVICNLPITDANFKVAWNLLTSRYDNNRHLIQAHLRSLMSLPFVTVESASAIRALRDKVAMVTQALRNLGRSVDSWDDILVFLVVERLDKSSRKAWELQLGSTTEYASYNQLDRFLEARIQALESLKLDSTLAKTVESKPRGSTRFVSSHAATAAASRCPLCRERHSLHSCPAFRAKTPAQRFEYAKSSRRCLNCLSANHLLRECPSKYSCQQCKRKHHTLLHFGAPETPSTAELATRDNPPDLPVATVATHVLASIPMPFSPVLLATARIIVSSPAGPKAIVRALLDQGSVTTLISKSLCHKIRAPQTRVSVAIVGIGQAETTSRFRTTISVSSRHGNGPAYSTTSLVLDSLSQYAPPRAHSLSQWKHLTNLPLADPDPTGSDPIDIIIGADLYGMVLRDGLRRLSQQGPIAQNSIFGWILSGPTAPHSRNVGGSISVHHLVAVGSLEQELRKFWEIENISSGPISSLADKQCEEHFVATHTRKPDGRYVVRIPFKVGPPINIGDSRQIAQSMLHHLESRLNSNRELHRLYADFLDEYERLGHMHRVSCNTPPQTQTVYIPHHAVARSVNSSIKLRVVFNASQRTSNGTSLNDHQLIGPKLQTDLSSILLRWRQFPFVLATDIVKMYRQIEVDPRDVDFQRILWRRTSSEPIAEYQLRTVTYGMASAPFLALRVLRQLVLDEGSNYPLAADVILQNTYIDDCLFGADSLERAKLVRDQLISLLATAKFELSKWASNSSCLLADLSQSDHSTADSKAFSDQDNLKVLGIIWHPQTDSFRFKTTTPFQRAATKRSVLSAIAKLFDPLGWVSPVVVSAKILMQSLWKAKGEWDDPLPCDLQTQWDKFQEHLHCLEQISIPRWTQFTSNVVDCQLHGFADASSSAYAAVIYLRVESPSHHVVSSLLAAKSRVAPIKPLTIPRLELSAALLLSNLVRTTLEALHLTGVPCHCWTDSTVTLHWISQSPDKWKSFVASRVDQIQSALPHAIWRHVPSEDNPADCASRGLLPSEIINHPLWWHGPSWLQRPSSEWPTNSSAPIVQSLVEARTTVSHTVAFPHSWDLASRYSSWPKLLRVSAYIFRFVLRISRKPIAELSSDTPPSEEECIDRKSGLSSLHPQEILLSKNFWIRRIQSDLFENVLKSLRANKPVSRHSPLLDLTPFLDQHSIIRVGGRLRHASIPGSVKNPIVLKSHPLVSLVIKHAHLRTLHAGTRLTLHTLRQEYWLLRARPTVRAVIHKCIPCARERAKVPTQLMGDLPSIRITSSSRAFVHCGLDYAGPFTVRAAPRRGAKTYKAYVALFICLVVKAVHLELVSDYSTAAFLAAYRRFCSRRGLPSVMYSDNGTNFRGADRELDTAFKQASRNPDVLNHIATDGVTWKFIPPSAPHFGGLWEAAIRSVKSHLKRVIGAHALTFEEFSTLLCEVEACLNSRPLAPISDNLDDFVALTSGHFLIGSAINSVPSPSLLDVNSNRLSRWQLLQQMQQSFWQSWAKDYMHGLQQRGKWKAASPNVTVGQLVLLRNPLEPPCKWALARVLQCFPGEDGRVRVVRVKTAHSEFVRPISKICLLPDDSPPSEPKASSNLG